MTNVTSMAGAFGYAYVGQVSRLSQISLPNLGTITNHYDALARLDYTALLNSAGAALDAYAYVHDPLGLRTNINRLFKQTSSSVNVGYDDIGQLTSWIAKESGGTLRWNEQ